MEDYTGKYLVGRGDGEYFVLYQVGHLLFCLEYSYHHNIYNMAHPTVEEIIEYEFSVVDETPYWLDEDSLNKWHEKQHDYGD